MDNNILLQKYLDGELGPEEERRALHIFADDPELRQMIRFDQTFRSSFQDMKSWEESQVPAGFANRVMHSIREKEGSAPGFSIRGWIADQLEWIWQPRMVQWRPIYTVVAVVLIMISVSMSRSTEESGINGAKIPAGPVQTVSESAGRVWLRFIFVDDDARTVEVAGDFSNWKPIPLTKQIINGEHVWTAMVSMERGEHRYMFVKNGKEWVTDPLAPVQREDGFGNKNAVIYL